MFKKFLKKELLPPDLSENVSVRVFIQETRFNPHEIMSKISPRLREGKLSVMNLSSLIPAGVDLYPAITEIVDAYLDQDASIVLITSSTFYSQSGKNFKDLEKKYTRKKVICVQRSINNSEFKKIHNLYYEIGKSEDHLIRLFDELGLLKK